MGRDIYRVFYPQENWGISCSKEIIFDTMDQQK